MYSCDCVFSLCIDVLYNSSYMFVFVQVGEWSPVLIASYFNRVDVLELLIQHGAQLDVRGKVC